MVSAQSNGSDLAARIERIESREAVLRTVHEFSHGFDKRDLGRLLASCAPDVVWLVAPGHEAVGHDGLRAYAEMAWHQMAGTHHWTCNALIDLDGDRATGTIDVDAVARTRDGGWHQSAATYHDTYVRLDGRWVIQRRRAAIHATIALAEAPARHPWGDIADG
ncbi:nuclear transport factor 2 family protein [Streptomyces sp. NPDC056296]|uniref:nuclear transport factor 2 family protein n=1 Tax=Streptomyces sp. NPDC056296 TaxID=3345775 RepID=UPI0035E15D09